MCVEQRVLWEKKGVSGETEPLTQHDTEAGECPALPYVGKSSG